MAEYIEREAALRECQNAIFVATAQKHYFDEFCINLKQKITKIPAADVVEVRHGEWEEDDYKNKKCSVCGKSALFDDFGTVFARSFHLIRSKYCPNCGAKMDGKGGVE